MGAWGYKPLDSDQALDWLGNEVTDPVGLTVKALLDDFDAALARNDKWACEDHAYQLRAAALVVISLNFFSDRLHGDLFGRLADALTKIRESEWMDNWDNPDAVRDEIDKQIEALTSGPNSTTLLDNLS